MTRINDKRLEARLQASSPIGRLAVRDKNGMFSSVMQENGVFYAVSTFGGKNGQGSVDRLPKGTKIVLFGSKGEITSN